MKITRSFASLLPRLTVGVMMGGLFLFYLSSSVALTDAIQVGDTVPAGLSLHFGFPPEDISLDERLKDKNVLLM
jgi:hypothetical protein